MIYIKQNAYFRSIYEHNVRSTHIRTPLSTHKLPYKNVKIVCGSVLHLRTSSTHIRTLLEITYTNTTLNTQIIIHEFKDCMRICTAHTCTMVYIKHNAYFRSIYEHNVRSTHIRTPLSTHKLPSENVQIVCGFVLHLRTSSHTYEHYSK